jgi:transcriptional regulator with XRE-family HTH domain
MGIAQRSVAAKYEQKLRGRKRTNALVANAKSLGDWIRIRREARNLTPSHLAMKMGIAAAVVYSWEDNTHPPDSQQLADLSTLLGFNYEELKMFDWQSMNQPFLAV